MNRRNQLNALLMLVAGFMAQSAGALSTPTPPTTGGQIVYLSEDERLSEAHKTLLDEQVAKLLGKCDGGRKAIGATVTYEIAPSSLPRNDYQLIGSRTESLRSYLIQQHQIEQVGVQIVTRHPFGYVPAANSRGSAADYNVWVSLSCR